MNIILDLIIIAIVVLCVVSSVRKGFVRTVIELVGFIAAIIIAIPLGNSVSGFVYDKAVGPDLTSAITEEVKGVENINQEIDKVWENLPDYITENSEIIGISKDKLKDEISKINSSDTDHAFDNAINGIVRPVFVKIFGMLCAAILFIILTVIVKIVANLINGLFSFSFIGTANQVLGGVVGAAKGGIFAVVFCLVISFAVSLSGGFAGLNADTLADSHLLGFILSLTPYSF